MLVRNGWNGNIMEVRQVAWPVEGSRHHVCQLQKAAGAEGHIPLLPGRFRRIEKQYFGNGLVTLLRIQSCPLAGSH